MSKPRKDEPLKMPSYRGGNDALFKFVKEHLKYPKEALDHKIEGSVEVAYDVDGSGKVRNIRILESLGYGCDEEVIRLVSMLKYEKAFNKGRNVTLHRKLKVNFKLPEEKKTAGQKINYQLVQNKPKTEQEEKKPTKTISYTINFN